MPASAETRNDAGPMLVTGATGFLGRAVADALAASGHQVLRGARTVPAGSGAEAGWIGYGEIGPDTAWQDALRGVKTVVHLAGLAHEPDRATSDVATFRRVNAGGTASLVAAAGAFGIRRFIYVSTVLVHGRSSPGRPLTEDDPFRPDGPYATSKVDAEEHVRRLADAAGMEWVILRPPMVYGPGARGNFRRLYKLVASGVPLPLARASAPRSLIGVDNFVSATLACLHHPKAANRSFLVSDRETTSVAELIELIGKALGRRPRNVPVPPVLLRAGLGLAGRGRDIGRLFAPLEIDSSRIRTELDWSPPISLAEGVRRAVSGA